MRTKPSALCWTGLALYAACCQDVGAQSVFGSIFPSPASWFNSNVQVPDAKPFGEELTLLPGERITQVSKLKGKWFHRQLRRNVELDHVRVPQLFTSMLIDLQADGSYTLDYAAIWGGTSNTPDSRYASLEAHEKGRFSVSGSILLLEASAVDVTRSGKAGKGQQHLDSERRAYLVRRDQNYLNLAGACAPYQAEEICRRYRSVWFSMPPLQPMQPLTKP